MRRRIVWLVIGVLVWAVVAVFVYHSLTPDDVPLRVGMHEAEIPETVGRLSDRSYHTFGLNRPHASYLSDPDWSGNSRFTTVYFDEAGRVVEWETCTVPWSREDWIEHYRKTLGW